MNGFYEQALNRIDEEQKRYKGDRHGSVMAPFVAESLKQLCCKNGEFAQAVAQGGDFKGCMDAVVKAIKGNAISDIDAYCAAARYYFDGCTVKMQLTIDMGDGQEPEVPKPTGRGRRGITIELGDFL